MSTMTAGIAGPLSQAISPVVSPLLSGISNRILYNGLNQAISYGLTSFGLGTGMSLLSGNSLRSSLGNGLQSAEWGAV